MNQLNINNKRPTVDAKLKLQCFPINSLQEFERIDLELKANTSFSSCLTEHLSRMGGRNQNHFVRGALKFLMMKEVTSKFSWLGLKQNHSLKSTTVGEIMMNVCCKTYNITEHEVGQAVSEVLRRKSKLL